MRIEKILIMDCNELRSLMNNYYTHKLQNDPELLRAVVENRSKFPKPAEMDCAALSYYAEEEKVVESKVFDKRQLRGANSVQVHDLNKDTYYTIWKKPAETPTQENTPELKAVS